MDITEGAIKAIQAPVREAETLTKAVQILDIPGDVRRKLLVQAGKHEFLNVLPPLRKHVVYTLADLIAFAKECEEAVSIWFNRDAVVLLIDDDDRRETVTLPLSFSDAWAKLQELGGRGPLTQKDTIKLLKNYLGANSATVAIFRKLDFESRIKTSGAVERGRESLGRSIEGQVQGTSDLIEDLSLEVPIYATAGERQTYGIHLLIDYDIQAARIVIEPEPDQLMELEEAHQENIRDRLLNALPNFKIYHGVP